MAKSSGRRIATADLGARTVLMALLSLAILLGCSKPYRVGEFVLVEWEPGKVYPAYIVEISSSARYRVHFDGYDARWDEDVGIDRIKGRVEGPVTLPPPPEKVARALLAPKASPTSSAASAGSAALAVNPYKPGDRVRVTWRGSIYSATVLDVVAKDRVLVHYEGYENVWDEAVHTDRIVSKRF
jgi:hypothetical protein